VILVEMLMDLPTSNIPIPVPIPTKGAVHGETGMMVGTVMKR